MDFNPSIEQDMLRDSARQFISTELSFERRQRRLAGGEHDDWSRLADLGWLAMAVPEDADGLGSSAADLAILCEELGRGLCLHPFIGCAVLPARLLAIAEQGDNRREVLAAIASGQRRVAVALYEHGRRFDVFQPVTRADRLTDGSFRVNGSKVLVHGASNADTLIVPARVASSAASGSDFALLLVDARLPGVSRRAYRTLDDVDAVDVAFNDVPVAADNVLVFAGSARYALEHALDEAIVCLCADVVGAMSIAVDMTAEYLHLRKQFGKPLADFQALQHAVAEMFIEMSDARSMLYQAIGALTSTPQERRKGVSACKVKVMEAAKQVTGMAVHLHGGIGVTTEYPIGHYLRRVMVAERLYGDNEHHLQRYMGEPRTGAGGDGAAIGAPTALGAA